MNSPKTKSSPLFIVLAIVTLALSSWGLFRLFHDFGGMPPWLAVLAVGGLDVVAVLCGKHALTVARDGDSSAPWNAALVLFTGLAAAAQYSHAVLASQPVIIGVTMAAFPVATVLLFEGQLRRTYRLNGRATGRLAPPRATFDLITWVLYRRLAMQATKFAVLDRGLDSDTALALAEAELTRKDATEYAPTKRRMQRTYAHLLGAGHMAELEVAWADGQTNGSVRVDEQVGPRMHGQTETYARADDPVGTGIQDEQILEQIRPVWVEKRGQLSRYKISQLTGAGSRQAGRVLDALLAESVNGSGK